MTFMATLAIEVEQLTGLSDFDRVPDGRGISTRERQCSCGQKMVLALGFDKNRKLKDIECIEGAYLRSGSNHFLLNEIADSRNWISRTSEFVYCQRCHGRRAWRLFE